LSFFKLGRIIPITTFQRAASIMDRSTPPADQESNVRPIENGIAQELALTNENLLNKSFVHAITNFGAIGTCDP
jgi:hypothetical protein